MYAYCLCEFVIHQEQMEMRKMEKTGVKLYGGYSFMCPYVEVCKAKQTFLKDLLDAVDRK